MSAFTVPAPADLGAEEQIGLPEQAGVRSRKVPSRGRDLGPQRSPDRRATDDEILGIGSAARDSSGDFAAPGSGQAAGEDSSSAARNDPQRLEDVPGAEEALRAALDANPELRRVWDDAQAYREAFATPEAAQAATAQLADLGRLDTLFFSRRPEDHAELARVVAGLDPAAFASLAQAMASLAAAPKQGTDGAASSEQPSHGLTRREIPRRPQGGLPRDDNADGLTSAPTASQVEFFHSANDAAVRGVLEAIETQVERLLPEGVSKNARNRVVGEIYRELDNSLRSNRQLADQMRHAFRSGGLDAAHQRAIVSLVTGRARQALPGIARRVLSEWTSTLVAANQDRRTRQRAAERRVDIAGASGGNDGRRSMTPRDLDYKRLSDADILNL